MLPEDLQKRVEAILDRLRRRPLCYPLVNHLSEESLFQPGAPRYALLSWLVDKFHPEDKDENEDEEKKDNTEDQLQTYDTHIQGSVTDSRPSSEIVFFHGWKSAGNDKNPLGNDGRERDLLQSCDALGLLQSELEIEAIQGTCTMERNIAFLTHLLDLVETHMLVLEQGRAASEDNLLHTLVLRDTMLVKQVAENSGHVFSTECKLFSNDIMKRLPNEMLPTLATLVEGMERSQQLAEKMEREVKMMTQKVNQKYSRNRTLTAESVDEHPEDADQSQEAMEMDTTATPKKDDTAVQVPCEEKAAQITNHLSSFEFLIRKFTTVYVQDFEPFLEKVTSDPSRQLQLQGLGPLSADVLVSFRRIKQFLESVSEIRRLYNDLCHETHPTRLNPHWISEHFDDAAIERMTADIATLQQSIHHMARESKMTHMQQGT